MNKLKLKQSISRVINQIWSSKNQPSQSTPVFTCLSAETEIIRSRRITIHVQKNDYEGFFHECSSSNTARGVHYHTVPTNTSKASEIVAELLGLKYLIPPSRYVRLIIDDKIPRYGLMTDPSPGISLIAIPDPEARKHCITPSLQRALNALNLLDVVCMENDHHPSNYQVVFNEKGEAVTVSAFDNNGESAFRFSRRICISNNKNCSPLVHQDGIINRPYLDADLIEALDCIQFRELYSRLKNYLPALSIVFTWSRIKALRKAVHNSIRNQKTRLLKPDEWNKETIEEELSGSYGKTYLHSFIWDCIVPEGALKLSGQEKMIVDAVMKRTGQEQGGFIV